VYDFRIAADTFRKLLAKDRESFTARLSGFVERQRAGGVTDENILAAMQADFEGDGPVFGAFKNSVARQAEHFLNAAANQEVKTVLLDEFGDFDKLKARWVAMMVNTCSDCVDLHGQVKTYAEWQAEGEPNVRNTPCTYRSVCHCELIPEDTITEADAKALEKPIELQSDRIAEYKRLSSEQGRKLSDEYKLRLMGEANNKDSVVRQ
jgi:hypothetical protein